MNVVFMNTKRESENLASQSAVYARMTFSHARGFVSFLSIVVSPFSCS